MSKDLTKTQKNEVGMPVQKTEDILHNDVMIPRLQLCQGLSAAVTQGKAKVGDLVRSSDYSIVGWNGTPEKDVRPVEFVPLTFHNRWIVQKTREGKKHYPKPEFVRFEERNARNDQADWNFSEGDSDFKRIKVIEVFALLTEDINVAEKARVQFAKTGDLPDLNATLLPVVITFKGPKTYDAGKAVVTHFAQASSMSAEYGKEIKAHNYKMLLTSLHHKNDKGEFFVMEVRSNGKASDVEASASDKWCQLLKQVKVNVEEFVEDSEVSTPQSGGQSLSESEDF